MILDQAQCSAVEELDVSHRKQTQITGHPTALPPIPQHMDSLGKVLVFNITEL